MGFFLERIFRKVCADKNSWAIISLIPDFVAGYGNPAKHTQRLIGSEDLIVVGAAGMYEARCRRCFESNLRAMEAEKKKRMDASCPADEFERKRVY